jgi:hypothetical protein
LSEPRVLVCGAALDAEETLKSLEMLQGLVLPNATNYVVTTGKFDTGKSAKIFNVEANYPPEPAHLQTLAAWAEIPYRTDPRFRDGHDFFCLKRILSKNDPVEVAMLLRDPAGLEDQWPELMSRLQGRLFLSFRLPAPNGADRTNVLFNLAVDRSSQFLDLTWEFYSGGGVYGLSPYSVDAALETVAESQRLVRRLNDKSRSNLV